MKPIASNAAAVRMGSNQVSEFAVDVSPDGKWMAYQGDPTRRMEVYLRRLDDTTGDSTIRVSSDGGTGPRWRADGRELFYLADSGKLMSVAMKSLDPPLPGATAPLFNGHLEPGTDRQYDVSHDGRRFILNRTLVQEKVPIAVLVNWQERLRLDHRRTER